MPTISLDDTRVFRGRPAAWTQDSLLEASESISLPDWDDDQWRQFLQHTDVLEIPAGQPLIRRGESDSNLYFVLSGKFEVFPIIGDSLSLKPLFTIQAGSVLGEMAFFDGGPRSANVWSIDPSTILRMSHRQFEGLEASNPKLAGDLVLSLARILSIRLRKARTRFWGAS